MSREPHDVAALIAELRETPNLCEYCEGDYPADCERDRDGPHDFMPALTHRAADALAERLEPLRATEQIVADFDEFVMWFKEQNPSSDECAKTLDAVAAALARYDPENQAETFIEFLQSLRKDHHYFTRNDVPGYGGDYESDEMNDRVEFDGYFWVKDLVKALLGEQPSKGTKAQPAS